MPLDPPKILLPLLLPNKLPLSILSLSSSLFSFSSLSLLLFFSFPKRPPLSLLYFISIFSLLILISVLSLFSLPSSELSFFSFSSLLFFKPSKNPVFALLLSPNKAPLFPNNPVLLFPNMLSLLLSLNMLVFLLLSSNKLLLLLLFKNNESRPLLLSLLKSPPNKLFISGFF